jgi:DNA-directed RNA polymerase
MIKNKILKRIKINPFDIKKYSFKRLYSIIPNKLKLENILSFQYDNVFPEVEDEIEPNLELMKEMYEHTNLDNIQESEEVLENQNYEEEEEEEVDEEVDEFLKKNLSLEEVYKYENDFRKNLTLFEDPFDEDHLYPSDLENKYEKIKKFEEDVEYQESINYFKSYLGESKITNRQLNLELKAVEEAAKRYKKDIEGATNRNEAASLTPARKLLITWFEPLKEIIKYYQANAHLNLSNSELVKELLPYLNLINYDKMAVITMHSLLSSCLKEPQRGI